MALSKNKLIFILQFVFITYATTLFAENEKGIKEFIRLKNIAPEIIVDLRYATDNNFTGAPVTGYENNPPCITTKAVAHALKKASDELQKSNLKLKIFDAYRPKKAVNAFIIWAGEKEDFKTKNKYYPSIEKSILLEERYIASPSNHSRGSSVDLTIVFKNNKGQWTDLDMGGPFDFFGERSHYDTEELTAKQKQNRALLKDIMEKHGFVAYSKEWWHFTLKNPTFPVQEFDFEMHRIKD